MNRSNLGSFFVIGGYSFYSMTKTINTFVTLPPKLIEDFEKIQFSKIERNYALKFIDNLMKRSFREYGMIDGFVETPKNYFRKELFLESEIKEFKFSEQGRSFNDKKNVILSDPKNPFKK